MPAVGFFRREKRIDFNCAKKAQPGALANAKQFAKIDFVLGVPDGYVFLEVDEHQHRFGYDNESLSCDMKRMASVQESLAIESGFQLPNLYWLRYNPHAHRANGDLVKVPKAEREARLLAWLKAFAFAAPFGVALRIPTTTMTDSRCSTTRSTIHSTPRSRATSRRSRPEQRVSA